MKIKLKNVSIYYEIYGKGDPMIFIHGNQEDHHIFDTLIDALKDSYQIYALDSRNHGQSSKHTDFSYEAMTNDLYEFITMLEIKNPTVLGFSDGGVLALKLAIKAPNIANKLILCGVNYDVKGIKKSAYNEMLSAYKKTHNPLVKLMLDHPHISKKKIKNIEIKTLIVVGENDVIKLRHTRSLHHMIKDSSLLILDHKTHDDYITNSDVLKTMIKKFV